MNLIPRLKRSFSFAEKLSTRNVNIQFDSIQITKMKIEIEKNVKIITASAYARKLQNLTNHNQAVAIPCWSLHLILKRIKRVP